MKAGTLRHRITYQRQAGVARDSFGAEVPNWTHLTTQWSSLSPLRGREFFAAAQVNAEVSHLIVTRYFPGLLPGDRSIEGARIFDLTVVINVDERNREYNLYARELI